MRAFYGEYVSFVDADDWVEPDFLSTLYQEIISNGADVSFCDFALNGDGVEHDWVDGVFEGNQVLQLIIRGGVCNRDANKLYSRNVVEGIFFRDILEDGVWTPQVLARANKAVRTGHALYNYRIHTDSVSHRKTTYAERNWY